ncbi:PKD domain-containing protein [Haloprofundus marisrubri]|nr:PKD domain-containing protein [Haloprofundus marisrubri]
MKGITIEKLASISLILMLIVGTAGASGAFATILSIDDFDRADVLTHGNSSVTASGDLLLGVDAATEITNATLSQEQSLTAVRVNVSGLDSDETLAIDVFDSESLAETHNITQSDMGNSSSGTVTVELSSPVTSNGNAVGLTSYESPSSSTSITVHSVDLLTSNTPPVADAGSDSTVSVGTDLMRSASGSDDPDGDSLSYEWDLDGDGTVDSTRSQPEHTYDTAGTYTVSLTVTDEHGASDTDTATVTVEEQTTSTPTDGSDNTTTTTEEPAAFDVTFNVSNNSTSVADASVVVTDENDTEVANLSTDANGSAVATLEDGNYSFTVSADGQSDKSGEFVVDGSDKTVSVDFADEEGGVVIIDDGGSSFLDDLSLGQIIGGALAILLATLLMAFAAMVFE